MISPWLLCPPRRPLLPAVVGREIRNCRDRCHRGPFSGAPSRIPCVPHPNRILFEKRVNYRRGIPMNIPTEPIGSIPRPPRLIAAIAGGDGMDPKLDPLYEAAIRDTIERF